MTLNAYDAGLLSDHGGGDIDWWRDYIRCELARAHDFYTAQLTPLLEGRLLDAAINYAVALDAWETRVRSESLTADDIRGHVLEMASLAWYAACREYAQKLRQTESG